MVQIFGRNDQTERDALEGRLIWIALRAFQLQTNVILDFGFWSKDERSSLRWFARQRGAKSQVIYLPIDPEMQRKRIQKRFAETPEQTWLMSEEELTKWRAFFHEPDEAELHGIVLEGARPYPNANVPVKSEPRIGRKFSNTPFGPNRRCTNC